MVDLGLANQFEFLFNVTIEIGLSDRLGLIEDPKVGKVSEGDDMLHAISKAYVLADFAVYFGRDSFVYDALNGHIFYYIFQRHVKRNHVLVVFDKLAIFL